MKHFLSFAFLLLILPCCMGQKIRYSYSDGSGNTYHLYKNRVEYLPIQPSESSSGTYSGGQPAVRKLGQEDYNLIRTALESGIADTASHVSDRAMNTGLIVRRTRGKDETWILDSRSIAKTMIETRLAKAIQ